MKRTLPGNRYRDLKETIKRLSAEVAILRKNNVHASLELRPFSGPYPTIRGTVVLPSGKELRMDQQFDRDLIRRGSAPPIRFLVQDIGRQLGAALFEELPLEGYIKP